MNKDKILLSSGNYSLIDETDFDLLSQFKWCESSGYAVRNTDLKKMHRLILDAKEKELVDHINRDKLDNRKTNLRIVTREQNVHNQKKRENTKSRYKGVCYIEKIGLFQARCRMNHQDHFLGYYSSEEAAAHAYNLKAKELSDCIFLNQINNDELVLNEMVVKDRRMIKRSNMASGEKHIYWHKCSKKWQVYLTHGLKRRFYGNFNDLNEAIKARDLAVTSHPKRLLG